MGDLLVPRQNGTKDEIARLHVDQVAKYLNEMRKVGTNCDCCLEVTGWGTKQSSQVHYNVVSAASEYCRSNSEDDNGKWKVEVDLRYLLVGFERLKEALEQCIEFMYTGKADIRDDKAECITELSHKLRLKPLEDMCFEAMRDNLTTWDKCHTLFCTARYCEREEYQKETIKKWIPLNLQRLSKLNKCPTENLWRSAADLFQTSFTFRQHCKMLDVLKLIEIEKADCEFLMGVVMTNEKVIKDAASSEYIFQIICQKINERPSNLNCGNYYKVKNLLTNYGRNDTSGLKIRLEKFMIDNFNVLAQQGGFLEIGQNEFTSILNSPELICTEKFKFDYIMKWVKHRRQRGKLLPDLFKMIKLQNMTVEELINIRKNPLVESNNSLLSTVFDALARISITQPQQPLVHLNTARWVMNQQHRPEGYNSSNESVRSGRSTCDENSSNGVSNFSTASLREDQVSLVTTTDSGADVDGDRAYNPMESEV